MSYEIGLNTLRLQATPRLAHTDYVSSGPLIRAVTGLDPASDAGAGPAFAKAWQMDLDWWVHDGPIDWSAGRQTDMGHAEFLEGGTDLRPALACPFTDVSEVWAFDAVSEYGLPDFDDLVTFYERTWRARQDQLPEQVVTGGYYKTMISGAIQAFGWEMLLLAAADEARFARVIDGFFERTLYHMRAWAQTSAPVILQHDDMVWTSGAFLRPRFYHDVLMPRLARLWEPLKAAGKLVLFCSDGTFDEFVDDLVDAGADGLIFEPTANLDQLAQRYGQRVALIGSKLDCRTLTFGTRAQIAAEIDATLAIARDCPGFMFAVGNHIPANVPVDNALFYFDYLTERWER